ncbi:MAG: protein-disulfide reductase DsbD domain-containing protein, partial [Caulobacteraceae bacterium]
MKFRILAVALALVGLGASARAQTVSTPHVASRLVAETRGAAPGSTVWLALDQKLDKGWHTYWRNPGDAGEAASFAWTLPAGWRAGAVAWPTPRRLPVGPIMNYGYEGEVLFPVPVEAPASARPGESAQVSLKVDYLVCAEVCIPGSATLKLDLPVVAGIPARDPVWGPAIAAALAAAPKPAGLAAHFQYAGGRLNLAVAGASLVGATATDTYFYPYDDKLIDHAKPQGVDRGPRGLTLALAPGAAFAGAKSPDAAKGVLTVDGHAYEVDARRGPPPPGSAGLGPPRAAPAAGMGLALAAAAAFAGGLILNLMPCVFPILSMKAAGFAGHGGEPGRARGQGVAFLAGVMTAFLALAMGLVVARSAGAAIGWGFQLQSPLVVALLALVILAAALNLSGLFEIGTSAQGLGSDLAARGGLAGSAMTGVLAVVVAAPCTAPFMGPALGYALTQPTVVTLAVFLALGLGFAAPFTLLAFSPGLIARLPRPGAWMDIFRKALAFPMYAAAAWLVWVLAQQTGSGGLARMLAAAVALALAAWLFGLAQRRHAQGGRPFVASSLAVAAGIACLATVIGARFGPATATAAAPTPGALAAQPWTPERLADLRAAGHPVLVNFTAAWCVTCQVNERLAFSS